jgi:hypothetical protein
MLQCQIYLVSNMNYLLSSVRNWVCVVGGVVGIAIFLIARNPFLAFLATLTAEVLAIIPTMAKTYAFPREEDFLAWTFTIIGNTLNFLALSWANHTELILSQPPHPSPSKKSTTFPH